VNQDFENNQEAANNAQPNENQPQQQQDNVRKGPRKRTYIPREGGGNGENQGGGGGGYRPNRGGGYRSNNNGGNRGGGFRGQGQNRGGFKRNNNRQAEHKDMYYITLLCPPEIDDIMRVEKEKMATVYESVVAAKSPAHITLVAPFFLSAGKHRELVQRLEEFESIVTEVNVDINNFGSFANKVIFADVIPNDNLAALQEQLENYLKASGFPFIKEAQKPFHPHVTIATRDLKPEKFAEAWETYENATYSASFTTNAIHVMKLVDDKWIHEHQFILK
jgi:2'-5' RNA ligase